MRTTTPPGDRELDGTGHSDRPADHGTCPSADPTAAAAPVTVDIYGGTRRLHAIVDVSDGWDALASCRTEDAALFFGPNRFESKADRLERESRAKAVCAGCPVLTTCRDHALSNEELYGVWGGLSELERRTVLERSGATLRAG